MTSLALRTASRSSSRRAVALASVLAIAALAAIPFTTLLAQTSSGPFTVVETGQSYPRLQLAVDAIGEGGHGISVSLQ